MPGQPGDLLDPPLKPADKCNKQVEILPGISAKGGKEALVRASDKGIDNRACYLSTPEAC
jgi:hypothetical protein